MQSRTPLLLLILWSASCGPPTSAPPDSDAGAAAVDAARAPSDAALADGGPLDAASDPDGGTDGEPRDGGAPDARELADLFDHVERFDGLSDWHGVGRGDVFDPSDMPTTTDGGESRWTYYSYWGSGESSGRPDWIADHGAQNVWGGSGKSLRLDYSNEVGPSRLGFSVGASPSEGYDDVYVFFMVRYTRDFFPMAGDDFQYFGYLKTLQISSGFQGVSHWGTPEEHAVADDRPQTRRVYGLNYVIMNLKVVGGSLFPSYNGRASNPTGTSYERVNPRLNHLAGASVGEPILAGEWFGIEYHMRLSDPHGAANGVVDVWIYDQDGNVTGQDTVDMVTIRDAPEWPGGAHVFDHRYNKFVWGGNRFGRDFESAGRGDHFVDDIVVHGSRIGPTYFEAIGAGSPAP